MSKVMLKSSEEMQKVLASHLSLSYSYTIPQRTKENEMKVKFNSFAKQKQVTNSINPNAVFQVTAQDGEWLTLNGRFEVHVSEVHPV